MLVQDISPWAYLLVGVPLIVVVIAILRMAKMARDDVVEQEGDDPDILG